MTLVAAALLSAALAASLEVRPHEAKPGDAILLVVTGAEVEPAATVEGREVRFWQASDGWRAVAGIPVEAAVGPLAISGRAGPAKLDGAVTIVDPAFPAKVLTLPPKYIEPPASVRERMAADQRAFNEAFARPFAAPRFARPFDWPLVAEKTGGYGDRRTYNGRQRSQHYGLDLDAAVGTPIVAANDGLVVMARDNYQAGLTVLIWHGADLYSAYFHLSQVTVKSGQAVARGDRIGLAGSSGRATGPHLHWGIKVAGRWVDPESVLRLGDLCGGACRPAPPSPP
jgi:murein DD-endopeptidase MepM/ murein hydrolase activator NlpD